MEIYAVYCYYNSPTHKMAIFVVLIDIGHSMSIGSAILEDLNDLNDVKYQCFFFSIADIP